MNATVLFVSALVGFSCQAQSQGRLPHQKVVTVGWHDEMDSRSNWGGLNVQNKAFVATPAKGTLFLGLNRVPPNWPYQYQWSGVTQDATVDLAHFPVLMARTTQIQGYAHLDIDVLGQRGEVLNTLRTSTLNKPGLSVINLSKQVTPGLHKLRLRLIVGGSNDGCCATYDWVRFVSQADAEFLTKHPDWNKVRLN
jgi:hypothetical protein